MASTVPPVQTPAPSPHPAAHPAAATAVAAVSAPAAHVTGLTLGAVNVARLTYVVNRMTLFFNGGARGDPSHLLQPCYALARGIDFSVTAGEVYANSHELPPLIKQVYKYRNEASLQAAIMVLLISVKNACRKGWFQVAESNELLAMANEMSSNYTHGSGICEESKASSVLSIIMPRFYPRLKLGSLLVSFEAKPGYDVLVADFNVPRNMPPQEKIQLIVAQTDNMETSSCLSSPPHVNFLINGKGVERRICGYADVGPQFPTDITKMLKYGINLIQAIGYFGGNYVVAVAFMRTITSPGVPILQDYAQPIVATIAQDAEIIEGPSKVSLNCPISLRRIKTPVKGHRCKHHQCFDYENFMAMNARKPSWRCPHCNQRVSCLDIRIDQNMVQILAATEEDVVHVIISADGSWKVEEYHSSADIPLNGMLTSHRDDCIGCELNRPSNSSSAVVDLTMEEDSQADVAENPRQTESFNSLLNQSGNSNACDSEERKPFQDIFQPFSLATPTSVATDNISQIYTQVGGGGLLAQNASSDPVITDAIPPALNHEDADSFLLPASAIQSTTQARQFMDNLQLQQTRFGNSIMANETERQPIPRHVNRTPIAIQALPAQPQIPSFHQRPQTTTLGLSSVPSVGVQASSSVCPDEINSANNGTGRQQYSRIPNSDLSSAQLHSAIQHIMGLPAQSPASVRPLLNQQRVGFFGMQPPTGGQNAQQQHLNAWTQQTLSQPANIVSQPTRFASIPVQRATQGSVSMGGGSLVTHNQRMLTPQSQPVRLQATLHASRNPSFQAAGDNFRPSAGEQVRNVGEGTPETLRSSVVGDMSAEQSWRPTGRMRGSLTGSAYAAVLSHYMLRPSQSASSRPVSTDQSRAATSEHYPVLIPNGTTADGSFTEHSSLRNDDSGSPLRV